MIISEIAPAAHVDRLSWMKEYGGFTDEMHWALHQGSHKGWASSHSIERHIKYCRGVERFHPNGCNASYAEAILKIYVHTKRSKGEG